MLEQMHKHMKWILWGIIVLITVTFLFFGIYPSSVSGGTAAKVDGYAIGSDEVARVYQNMYENYRQILKDQMNESFAKALRGQALRELIRNRLLLQEADRIGLRVSDDELQAYILQIPTFSYQGRFNRQLYERALTNINMTPAVFEMNQRDYLLRQKLERLVEDGVSATDAEIAAAYAAKNPKAKAGEYDKNKDSFRKTYLEEKKRSALDAFVKGLENKASIPISDKSLAS